MGKVQKKTNNSAFSATHTYIKLTLVIFFLLFLHAPSPYKDSKCKPIPPRSSHIGSLSFLPGVKYCIRYFLDPPLFKLIYSNSFHIYLKFLISIQPAEIKDNEEVKSQIEQHQDHHLQFGIFNNSNIL